MEIKKANDILVATINNPNASTYDLMTLDLTPDNTQLLRPEDYKQSKLIQDNFSTIDGKFDEIKFNQAYNIAANHYKEMSDEDYINKLNTVEYSPFDVTRPFDATTFRTDVEFSKDFNPFKQTYSRSSINSVDESNLSLRELAQQSKVFDIDTKTWSNTPANDMNLFDKVFGKTLVYAQWDDDGSHIDPETGKTVDHKKGDWKVNSDGNLYLETLGDREIYNKQVVNPMDMLTTDGSVANQFDIFDSDSKEKSAIKTTLKIAADIAPLLIPGVNTIYGGVKAAISLATVMPTFYKSLESLLVGDYKTPITDAATAAEGYLAKFVNTSISDEGQTSLFNYEQISQMVSSVFSQIYEQRAMAGLSNYIIKSDKVLAAKEAEYSMKINESVIEAAKAGIINLDDTETITKITKAAYSKIPELEEFQKTQSSIAKALSLGYMALTSTADIYGEALNGGYDRRTAGFAALAAATGQYGIMMNNRMGDWFLDKTTGYTKETNKALVRSAVKDYLEPIQKGIAETSKDAIKGKLSLAEAFKGIKNNLVDTFTSPTVLGENMFKNAMIEGVEEVTEQAVLDATKGIVDVMSYLGLTKKQGSLGGWDNVFSKAGLENYIANFVGGVIGGAMFELNTGKIEPLLDKNKISEDTKKDIYTLIGNGQTSLVIDELNKQRYKLGNNFISPVSNNEKIIPSDKGISQADFITDTAINIVKNIDGIMNSKDLIKSDEEIIKKAMLDTIIIGNLKDSIKGSGIGIEGIIVDDFRNNAKKITDLQLDIQKLSSSPEEKIKNAENIKKIQEESKIYEDDNKDIINGKKAEEYYNQISFYLSKKVSESWMAIDRDSYTKIKYNKNFNTLPDSGFGITKDKVTTEWKEVMDSKDIRNYIGVATKAYLEGEKKVNSVIDQYINSGYAKEAANTYKNLIDLDATIKSFNTATNDADKENLIERFKYISNTLKTDLNLKLGIVPSDVYKNDLAKMLLSLGMVGKPVLNENGEYLLNNNTQTIMSEPLSEEELNKKNESGITIKESLEKSLDLLLKEVPISPMDINENIKILNNMIASYNKNIDSEILKINSKGELSNDDLEKITLLNGSKYDFTLIPYEDSESISNKKLETDHKITNLHNKLKNELGIDDNIINKFLSENYYKDDYTNLSWLLNTPDSEINEKNLTPEQIEDFNKSSLNQGLNQEKNLYNRLLEAKQELILSEVIRNNIESLTNLSSSEQKILKEFTDSIESGRPEIFKMRNYAFDLILKQLEGSEASAPSLDGALIDLANKIANEMSGSIRETYFKDFDNMPIDDLMYIVNNAKDLQEKINNSESINAYIEEEGIQDISGKALRESDLGEVVNKYIIEGDNNSLIAAISILSDLSYPPKESEQLNKFIEIKKKGLPYIENSLYGFLEKIRLSLYGDTNPKDKSVIDILEAEDRSIFQQSDLNNYTIEGIKERDIVRAINTLKIVRSSIYAMSTTKVSMEDPYGFIASRQNFLKKNGIKSDVLNLKTVTSDIASLMDNDLNRIQTKLQFYLDLSKSNSARIFNEYEITREKTGKILLNKLSSLSKNYLIDPIKDQINSIIKSSNSEEKKLLDLESLFFNTFKDANKEEVLNSLLKDSYISIDSRKLTKITSSVKTEDIDDYFFANYLATILSVDSKAFTLNLKSLLLNFDKSPFYTQELDVRVAYASIVNPELFSNIIKRDVDTDRNLADYITFILGNSGSGKTSVVLKMLTMYLQRYNPDLLAWFVGPTLDQANNLSTNILENNNLQGSITYSKLDLYNSIGIKEEMSNLIEDLVNGKDDSDYYSWIDNKIEIKQDFLNLLLSKAFKDSSGEINKNIPNLILIDEVTHFSSLEIEILNFITKSISSKHSYRIIGAGDTSQSGFKYGKDEEAIELNLDRVKGVYTPELQVIVRSENELSRENKDLVKLLSSKLSDIYHDPNEQDKNSKAIDLLGTYKAKKLFNLKFNKTSNALYGDKIIKSFDLTTKELIKNIINNSDKDIGILTEFGNLDDYMDMLTSLELVDANGVVSPRIKPYSLHNIQGSESDYFIFDTKLIKSKRVHHAMKDFYTYITRSKIGTLIIDSNNFSDTYGMYNSEENYANIRVPLDVNEIKNNRDKRILIMDELIGDPKNIIDNKFLFKPIKEDDRNEINDSILKEEDVPSKVFLDTPATNKPIEDDHLYMFHSFYNNPNTKLNVKVDANGKIIGADVDEITYDENATPTDLNIDKVSPQNKESVLQGWFNIKNFYTYNYSLPKDKDSNNYYKSLFGENITSTKIKTSLCATASKFSKSRNLPAYKDGFNIQQTLDEGDPFINISLKLEYKGITHYITLATLSSNTIKSTFGEESSTYIDYYNFINKEIPAIKSNQIIEIANNIKIDNQITSIRFLNNYSKKTYVKDITKVYKGLNRSQEIRFLPIDFDSFVEVWNKYTFGEKRSLEDKVENGSTIIGLKSLYNIYKGKPYIVISYNINDLGGSNSKAVQSKIMPLFSESRSFEETKSDIEYLRNLYFSYNENEDAKEDLKTIAKCFKNTVSSTQIIKILVTVSREYPEVFDNLLKKQALDTSILDLLKKVVSGNKDIVSSGILNVFNTIKNLRNTDKTDKDTIKEVWSLLTDSAWKNYIPNLFILDTILLKDIEKTTDPHTLDIYNTMMEDIKNFYNVIKTSLNGSGIYWETPKKGDAVISTYTEATESDLNSKLKKYQPESYLYFNSVPESPRFLVNLKNTFSNNPNINNDINIESANQEDNKKDLSPTILTSNEEDISAKVNFRNQFSPLISEFANYPATSPYYWKKDVVNLFSLVTDSDINKLSELGIESKLKKILNLLSINDLNFEAFKHSILELSGQKSNSKYMNKKYIIEYITEAITGSKDSEMRKTISNVLENLNKSCK